jgi:uncharacterized protein (TIGR03545 family)
MTNNDTTPSAAPTKKPKRQSLIRWEAVAPFTIFVLLIWAYFFFFFDHHLRKGIEYAATHANGAEVDVASVKTSFWNASLEIGDIQVTDTTAPQKNKIQIGHIRWSMLWDALLRGKIAIGTASILEISAGSPRTKPGRVLPPDPPSTNSAFDKLRKQAIANAQSEFKQNILGDAAGFLNGASATDQLNGLENQLKSKAKIKELQDELKTKQAAWKERLDKLPQSKDLDDLQKRVKAVKLDGFSNPAEVQKSAQQLGDIFKDADSKFKEIQSTGQALGDDLKNYQAQIAGLNDLVQQDIKDLESRMKLPKLDAQSLSRMLFGPSFTAKLDKAEFYMTKAREYMPPKKSSTEKVEAKVQAPKPHERAKGRNYKFGRPNSYPLFWVKTAEISSKYVKGADYSGDVTGTITDLTDDQPTLGRPMIARFKGDFPQAGYRGISGELIIDHVTENPAEKLALSVASFPVAGQQLLDTPDVKLGFDHAQGDANLAIEFTGREVKVVSKNNFTGGMSAESSGGQAASGKAPLLTVEATQPILNEALKAAVADIPAVNLNASVTGPWSDLQFNIDSNLGRDLSAALTKQLQKKIAEARAKLESFVKDNIGKQKDQLTAEFNKSKDQVNGILKGKEDEANKAKNSATQASSDATHGQTKKLEEQGKKTLDDLKKQFHF